MRTRSTITLLLPALSIGLIGCESTPTTTTSSNGSTATASMTAMDDAITTSTATLTVHGMGCPLCANNVDKQLKDHPGVRDVAIDMGTGRVTVYLEDEQRPTRSQLTRAIRQSGFTLVKIDTP